MKLAFWQVAKSKLSLALWTVSLLTSCNYTIQKTHPADPAASELTDFSTPSEEVTFAMVMKDVIGPKCLSCHSSANGTRGGIALDTFASVHKHRDAIAAAIKDGSMPQGDSLTELEKKFVVDWIEAGASEFGTQSPRRPNEPTQTPAPAPTPAPPPTGPNGVALDFATVQAKVLNVSCVRCHSGPKPAGGVNLETYAAVKPHLADIKTDVEDGSMPLTGTLTPDQKTLIIDWIIAGGPEKTTDPIPTPTPPEEPRLPSTPEEEILARGKYLTGLANCAACHTLDRAKPLAGGKAIGSNYGTFYAPNITASKKNGIGNWSKQDFLKAMRTGMSPSNKYYYPAFPFRDFSKMTDDDIFAIRKYILSLPATERKNTPHKLKFPFKFRPLIFAWRALNFPSNKHQSGHDYLKARGPFIDVPGKDAEWNRGAYLVEGPMHCTECHTPRDQIGGLKLHLWMSGGPALTGETEPAPNLTPSTQGLKSWTRADWTDFFLTGHRPTGGHVTGEMKAVITNATSTLTPEDASAVIDYLQSLTPVTVSKKK